MNTFKLSQLQALEAEMAGRALPLSNANLVFGEGNPDCRVMFVGEAPGSTEDRMKRPFVGQAGKLLDQLIKELGWKREDVYITNIVKRRPPENRNPLAGELEAYKPYLSRQIEIIGPKVIVPLGLFAMDYFLPGAKITRDHGRIFNVEGRLIFPLYHPSAALRSREVLDVLRTDFKKLPEVVSGETAV